MSECARTNAFLIVDYVRLAQQLFPYQTFHGDFADAVHLVESPLAIILKIIFTLPMDTALGRRALTVH